MQMRSVKWRMKILFGNSECEDAFSFGSNGVLKIIFENSECDYSVSFWSNGV